MYQPEEALAAYEIPTASETATPAAPPIHGCPDEPGRECMIRYLYARMKNHAVKCAHCGIIAARISNFYKAKSRAVAAKPKLPKISDDRRREVSLANLAKGRDKLLEKQAETRRIKAELREKERVQREAERAERREASRVKYNEKRYALRRESRVASAHEEAMALLDLARQGKKSPSRVQGVVLLLEWCVAEGVERISVRDFTSRFDAIHGTISIRSVVMSRSLRGYGLRVTSEYVESARRSLSFLYVDDAAKAFIAGGFVYHTRGRGHLGR